MRLSVLCNKKLESNVRDVTQTDVKHSRVKSVALKNICHLKGATLSLQIVTGTSPSLKGKKKLACLK